MATYIELFSINSNDELRNRVAVACLVAAEAIRNESDQKANHANRLTWAKGVFENPKDKAIAMLWAILAANKDLTVAQIVAVSDANLQTAVNNAVNVFAV